MRNIRIEDLVNRHGTLLELELFSGKKWMKRKIEQPEAHRPGLSLAGYPKNQAKKRIIVFGKAEIEYLRSLPASLRFSRLEAILTPKTPAVIVTRNYRPPKELQELCVHNDIPLFRTSLTTMNLMNRLTRALGEEFAPKTSCHGSFVEVFGVGVLIQGESAIGKSEAALGLIERGHRLVSDDLVIVKRKEEKALEGSGMELSRYHMEIRGVGIINVANLYGAVCVCEKKSLDIVVKLEVWDDNCFYDRVGAQEKTIDILEVPIPYHILPVKPGRDVILLLETIALNHCLKKMGYHSAKEFNKKLLTTILNKGKMNGRKANNHQKNSHPQRAGTPYASCYDDC